MAGNLYFRDTEGMNKRRISLIVCFCFFCIGCGTVKIKTKEEPLFFPLLSEPKRVQYLTSFSSSKDVEGDPSAFSKFVLGDVSVKPIIKPYGAILHDGKIYICDTVSNGIEILNLDEKTFEYFRPTGNGQLINPINIDLSSDGKMYVADSRRGQVLIFDDQKKFIAAIGSQGELKPTDVKLWGDKIFVCDLKTRSIRVYKISDLTYLYSIPPKKEESKDAKNQLFSPTNFDIDSSGNIYVSDMGDFVVKKISQEGELLKTFGSHGDALGQLARPKGVAVDKQGRVYIVDAAFENVQIFDTEGQLLMFFPEGENLKFVLPAGIIIDYDNIKYFAPYADKSFSLECIILVVSQYGDKKINVFGFGEKK